MIRFLYWLMVLVEVLILLATILLFMITDSSTIHIAAEDMLEEYNISYESISGNLFTGIEVKNLEQGEHHLVDSTTVYWNPLALFNNKVHITKLEIRGANPLAIIEAFSTLPSSDSKGTNGLDFDIAIDNITLTSQPFIYHGVSFKNFHLGTNSFELSKDMLLKSDLVNLSVDSDLVDVELRGKLEKNSLNLDTARLLNINPKVITSFMRSIKKESKKVKESNTTESAIILKNINISNFTASMKKTTYGPITLDKTRLVAEDVYIDPSNDFNYNAKSVTLSTDTSFCFNQTGWLY
ncbi:MAG: hypothetical protein K0U38_00275 [Epsilonproteobacteria bacterium]|nr:hypothetical protein [Campylobacterota bacterium]